MTPGISDHRFQASDELAIQTIMSESPGMDRVRAERIYLALMALREEGVREATRQGRCNSKVASVLTSEPFFQLLILVAIPLVRLGCAPLANVISRIGR
jgi:hypothetical protein